MIKVEDVFFTAQGRLARVVSEFAFGDKYKFTVAIWDGAQWVNDRLNETGTSISSVNNNFGTKLDSWINFYTFSVVYNAAENFWTGSANHKSLANLAAIATRCDTPEQVMRVLKTVTYEKMVDSLRPLGYTIKMQDAA